MYKLIAAAALSILALAACGGGDCKEACEAITRCGAEGADQATIDAAVAACSIYDVPGSCAYADDTVSCIADAGDDCEAINACE